MATLPLPLKRGREEDADDAASHQGALAAAVEFAPPPPCARPPLPPPLPLDQFVAACLGLQLMQMQGGHAPLQAMPPFAYGTAFSFPAARAPFTPRTPQQSQPQAHVVQQQQQRSPQPPRRQPVRPQTAKRHADVPTQRRPVSRAHSRMHGHTSIRGSPACSPDRAQSAHGASGVPPAFDLDVPHTPRIDSYFSGASSQNDRPRPQTSGGARPAAQHQQYGPPPDDDTMAEERDDIVLEPKLRSTVGRPPSAPQPSTHMRPHSQPSAVPPTSARPSTAQFASAAASRPLSSGGHSLSSTRTHTTSTPTAASTRPASSNFLTTSGTPSSARSSATASPSNATARDTDTARTLRQVFDVQEARSRAQVSAAHARLAAQQERERAEWSQWRAMKRSAMTLYRKQQAYQQRMSEKERRAALAEVGLKELARSANGEAPDIPESILRAIKEQELIDRCDAELRAAREKIEPEAKQQSPSHHPPPPQPNSAKSRPPRHKRSASTAPTSLLASSLATTPESIPVGTPSPPPALGYTHTRAATVSLMMCPPPLISHGSGGSVSWSSDRPLVMPLPSPASNAPPVPPPTPSSVASSFLAPAAAYAGYNYAYGSSVREASYDAPSVAAVAAATGTKTKQAAVAPTPARFNAQSQARMAKKAPPPSMPRSPDARTRDPLVAAALRAHSSPSTNSPPTPAFAFQQHRIMPYAAPGSPHTTGRVIATVAPVTLGSRPTSAAAPRATKKDGSHQNQQHHAVTFSPGSGGSLPTSPQFTAAASTAGTSSPSLPARSGSPKQTPRAFTLALHEFERQKEARQSRAARVSRQQESGESHTYSWGSSSSPRSGGNDAVDGSEDSSPFAGNGDYASFNPNLQRDEVASEGAALDTLGIPSWQLALGRVKAGPRLMHSDRRAMDKAVRDPTQVLQHNDALGATRVSSAGGVGKETQSTWHTADTPQSLASEPGGSGGIERTLLDAVFRPMPVALQAQEVERERDRERERERDRSASPSTRQRRRPSAMFSGPPVPLHAHSYRSPSLAGLPEDEADTLASLDSSGGVSPSPTRGSPIPRLRGPSSRNADYSPGIRLASRT